ncbi:MAG: hypothetical protein WAM94_14860, partial [Chromatiaceae bacterium]
MLTSAVFEDIPGQIARRLSAADYEIIVAVAWFTTLTLFETLCQQDERGVRGAETGAGQRFRGHQGTPTSPSSDRECDVARFRPWSFRATRSAAPSTAP